MRRKRMDLIGQKFFRLTVLGEGTKVGTHKCWKCICDCGKEVNVQTGNLISGNTKSCGCYNLELIRRKKVRE